MTKKTSDRELDDFNERLSRATGSIEERERAVFGKASAYSFGLRLVTDLVVGVLSGVGIGWLIDYFAGTRPWGLLIFMPIGMVAGVLNVIRAAKSVEAQRHLEKTDATGIPGVPFDDDDV